MIIKKLELQGFKSFPERTKIIFHPGITSIIGPNGTGKSNIVDALLWVLGGKRLKSLRAERSGDIIFNGNVKKPPMSMADVTLSLIDEEETLNINHRVFRSGESEYRLSGKKVRLKDIQESLWKKAIAEKEYYVIEQGSIDIFLSSKPIEKRLLLEEAAGTAYYKDKKRQTQNKLENSELNLTRLEDIIIEVSKAKNSLKRQAHAAEKYRALREKIRQFTFLNFRKKIEGIEKIQKETVFVYKKALDQENEIILRLKKEEKNLASKRKETWALEKSIKEAQENLFSLKSQLSRSEAEREKEIKKIELLEERKKKARENKAELEHELISIEKEREEVENVLKSLSETLKQKQQSLKAADQESQACQKKLAELQKNIETLRNEYLQKLSDHTEVKNEQVKLEKEMELTLRQDEKIKSQLAEEQSLLKQKEKELAQSKEETSRVKKLLEGKKKRLEENQKSLDKIDTYIDRLQNQIAELKRGKDKHTHHLHALEKLKQKEKSTDFPPDLPDTLGILADSIESDTDHTPLIDIFWKEEAKAVLVHTQDFLQDFANKGLTGNFLLLHPQRKKQSFSEVYHDPRVVGLLKSHIRPSQRIKKHVSQLNEAAIVKDIKNAVELWIRFPAVNYITIHGDLLLSSGLLKSGQKKEGIFSLSQEIKALKQNISLIDKKLSLLTLRMKERTEQKQKLEEKAQVEVKLSAQLERKIEELEKENYFNTLEIEKISTNISVIQKELEIFTDDKKAIIKKIETLSSKIRRKEQKEDSMKDIFAKAENDAASFQEENEQRRKHFFELKSSVDLLKEKIKNLNHQLHTLTQRKEIIETKLTSLHKEIRDSEDEKLHFKENVQHFSKKIKNLEEEEKEKETQLIQGEFKLKESKKEEEELEKRIEKLRENYEVRKEERVKWEIKKAEGERDLMNLEESCWQDLKKTLKEVKDEIPLDILAETDVEDSLAEAQEKLQKFTAVNLMAEEEYSIQKKRFDFLVQQKEDLRESIDSTREAIKKIDQESKSQFSKALNEVNKNFQQVFSLLFEGGNAELKLTDPNQPLESGVEITAQPPGKRVQSLSLLSGGEKSLTSLAFFFALFRYKPAPFCILDEVDAALDETNLSRFLNLMKKIKNQTQFILITHNFKTMEVADYIYGTTMAEPNITSIYSVKLETKGSQ